MTRPVNLQGGGVISIGGVLD